MKTYSINELVRTKVLVEDEHKRELPIGSILRIVAIAPKVYIRKYTDEYHDKNPDFYNAVLASEEDHVSNRIRENFCTIEKIK
jgi:hypothetical protein